MSSLKRVGRGLLAAGLALVAAGCTTAHDTLQKNAYWNLPSGVTTISHQEYFLHMMAFWVCVAICVVVFGVMFYSLFAHRRSKHPTPSTFRESTTVEIVWTIIPFLILIGMAIPAAATLIQSYDTSKADMTIKVTGAQWRWEYEYPDQGVGFVSSIDAKSNAAAQLGSGIDPNTVPHYLRNVDNPMVVPVGKKIRLLITAADVDHGWWVPDLGVKKNAYPGYINEDWFKADRIGTYRGQCTVLCGRGHGFMPIVVKVVSMGDFNNWVAEQKKDGHTLSTGDLKAAGTGDAMASSAAPAAAGSAAAPSTAD